MLSLVLVGVRAVAGGQRGASVSISLCNPLPRSFHENARPSGIVPRYAPKTSAKCIRRVGREGALAPVHRREVRRECGRASLPLVLYFRRCRARISYIDVNSVLTSVEHAMKHLLSMLAGVGAALNAFGTAPEYDRPRAGDQARDFAVVGADMRRVTARVERTSRRALTGAHGRANNSAS